MKKLLLFVLLSGPVTHSATLFAQDYGAQDYQSMRGDLNEFDSFADEMVAEGLGETVEIKEPSTFQLWLRRLGGPVVMLYVRMREKMNVAWAWMLAKKKAKKS